MSIWIIEPLDGLAVGDGRPFDNTPGAKAYTRPFPPPSVTAGGIRSRSGHAQNADFANQQVLDTLLNVSVAGPLLVQLTNDPTNTIVQEWFAPAPADALVFLKDHPAGDSTPQRATLTNRPLWADQDFAAAKCVGVTVASLQPTPFPDVLSDAAEDVLLLTCAAAPTRLADHTPRWWRWQHFEQWLLHAALPDLTTWKLGTQGPSTDVRTHVSIDPETLGAKEGLLFQTNHLDFRHSTDGQSGRFALAVRTDTSQLDACVAPLGGERRLMHWFQGPEAFPSAPKALLDMIAADKRCRVVLLTPAHWKAGYKPDLSSKSLWKHNGVTPQLRAVANSKPTVVSGWDFKHNQAKPSRRLTAAGSVLFLELDGTAEQRRAWAEAMWMHCISDDEQACRDGFGLAVVGAWPHRKESDHAS